MSLPVQRAIFFAEDFSAQAEWYARHGGDELAYRYHQAVEAALQLLTRRPGLGRTRRFRHSELKGLRSFRVHPPFNKHLVFYRCDEKNLYAERVIHGTRDLPRRLLEPPGGNDD